jgi:hypothetical protein
MDAVRNVTAEFTLNIINIQDAVIEEGDSGTVGMTFTTTLSISASAPVTVTYTTSEWSAVAGLDYETAIGQVVFLPGDLEKTIAVQVKGDLLDEEDETFDVILSNPEGAIILDGAGEGTILDNDNPPDMTIVPSIDLFEGNSGTANAVFTLSLSSVSGKTITVTFQTEDGSALGGNPIIQGIDYLRMNGQVVFSPGEIMKTIQVPLNSDHECEADEVFYLGLSGAENANLLRNRSQATIKNDDICFVFLPIISKYKMIFTDDFNSDGPWEEVYESQSDWFILNGEYHGTHVVNDRNAKTIAPVTSADLNGSYSVEVKIRSEIGSDEGGRGGLLFDYINNNATYRFVIIPGSTSEDNWLVQVRNTALSQWTSLGNGRDNIHINSGNDVNVLRVERNGSLIRAYVNNYLLWSGNDSTFINGRVGLNIGTPVDLLNGEYVEFCFDDFIVASLQ